MPGESVRPDFVIGPQGAPITLSSLPAMPVRRWVALRKAEVVAAVEGGLLSTEQACAMYEIELAEFESWRTAIENLGVKGLFLKNVDLMKRLERRRYR